jgi:hypothetical protein
VQFGYLFLASTKNARPTKFIIDSLLPMKRLFCFFLVFNGL